MAAGDSLLSPSVTRRVIDRMASRHRRWIFAYESGLTRAGSSR